MLPRQLRITTILFLRCSRSKSVQVSDRNRWRRCRLYQSRKRHCARSAWRCDVWTFDGDGWQSATAICTTWCDVPLPLPRTAQPTRAPALSLQEKKLSEYGRVQALLREIAFERHHI